MLLSGMYKYDYLDSLLKNFICILFADLHIPQE